MGNYEKVSKVDRDDVHQVIAYMTALHVSRGGFIAPLEKPQAIVPTSHLNGMISTLSIFGVEISKTSTSYIAFCEDMREMEEVFVKSLFI